MKDIKQNLSRSSVPRGKAQGEGWRAAFLHTVVKVLIGPLRFIGPAIAFGLGLLKIVLIFVGLITTAIVVSGTIIFKTFWNTETNPFQKVFTSVEEKTAIVVKLDQKVTDKIGLDLESLIKKTPSGFYPLLETIRKAKKDPRIEGIVLTIENHDLGFAEIQELRKALLDFQSTKKWVISYAYDFQEAVNDPTRSYYLASVSDEIWVHPLAQLDLVGVAMERYFVRGFLDKMKVKPHFFAKGKYKFKPEQYTQKEPSELNKMLLREINHNLSEQITKGIAEGRELKQHQVDELLDNAPWTDRQALKQGLVDNLIYADELRKKVKERFPNTKNFVSLQHYSENAFAPTTTHQFKKHAKETFQKDFRIAVVEFSGAISLAEDMAMDNSISAIDFKKQIRVALRKKPEALLIVIDSPGGTSMASEIAARELRRVRKKIPVVVLMGNVCASGGYWIACGADKIIANPATLTGSIGTFLGKMNTSGFWNDWGVHWHQEYSHKNGHIFSTQNDPTENDKAKLDTLLDSKYNDFIECVMEGRHLTREEVENVAEGRVWLGEEALKSKLIDGVGGFSQAIDECLHLKNIDPKNVVVKIDFSQKQVSFKHLMRQSIISEMMLSLRTLVFKAMLRFGVTE